MRRVALAIVSTVAGLAALLSFKTHSVTPVVSAASAATSTGPDSAGSAGDPGSTAAPASEAPSAAAPSAAPSSTASSAAPSAGTKTVTGDAADTRYGPVQVKITVTNGAVTDVTATEFPENTPRDEEINAYAIPELNSEATAAKNAQIDMVSGATYTSQGYIESLQSALDKAGL